MEDEITDMVAEIRRRKPTFTADQLANARPVVQVDHVSKRFCRDLKRSLLYGVVDIAREVTGREARVDHLRKHEFWALSDVSLEIMPGRAVGIVGTNGSGKTTLMRTLAGLIKPTKGQVTVRGRMAPLLALGAGFIPVLTGRENIYTNMSILGLTKEEIDARFDKVVEFSEIGYALDAPVQSFSSGMMARLGFSCAVETQPDILLLDEVLAVGDLKFKEKCLMRLLDIRARGTSMIVVHHSTDLLEKLCDEIIYINKGVVVARGDTEEVLDLYENDLELELRQRNRTTKYLRPLAEKPVTSDATKIVAVRAVGPEGDAWMVGQTARLEVELQLHQPCARLTCRVGLHPVADAELGEVNGSPTLLLTSAAERGVLRDVPAGRHVFRLSLPVVRLPRGNYYARVAIHEGGDSPVATAWSESLPVNAPPTRSGGVGVKQYLQEHEWTFEAVPADAPAEP